MLTGASTLPTLETPRLRLRWMTEADVPALFEILREGYQRQRYFLNGEIQDAVLYGLLRPEPSSR